MRRCPNSLRAKDTFYGFSRPDREARKIRAFLREPRKGLMLRGRSMHKHPETEVSG